MTAKLRCAKKHLLFGIKIHNRLLLFAQEGLRSLIIKENFQKTLKKTLEKKSVLSI